MYQTDVLELLWILAKLGRGGDEGARFARALVASKRDAQGRLITLRTQQAVKPSAAPL